MFGGDENSRQGFSDPRQAVETCGMVEQMLSDEELLTITGDTKWADHCENVAFNTYPAAVTPDFTALRYLTSPNMATSDHFNHAPGYQNSGPMTMFNPLSHRCCQHNHSHGWPYFSEHLWMATNDNGLAATLYSASSVTARAGNGQPVTIKEVSNYPFEDQIRFWRGRRKDVTCAVEAGLQHRKQHPASPAKADRGRGGELRQPSRPLVGSRIELDLERVVSERLSPLYVSIHATNPTIRADLLRNDRGAMSLRWLRALLDAGIEVHGQVLAIDPTA